MLKNPCKATRFYYDSHDCKSNSKCILQEGWLASLEGFAVPLAGLFHLICPSVSDTIFVTFKVTILRFGTEFLLYNLRSFAGIFTRMSIAWLFSANRKVIN